MIFEESYIGEVSVSADTQGLSVSVSQKWYHAIT